jgi:hypothetical protein
MAHPNTFIHYRLVYWSVSLREENIFEVYESTVKKISGPKRGNNKEWVGVTTK